MNHFPDRALYAAIPNALKAFAVTYEDCSKKSGRTTAALAAIADGDKVIFANAKEAMRFGQLAERAGKFIDCVVVPVTNFRIGLEARPGKRVWFDHGWLTEYWSHVIDEGSRKFWDCHELYNPSPQEVTGTPKAY